MSIVKYFHAIQHGKIKEGKVSFQDGIFAEEKGFFATILNCHTKKYFVLRGAACKSNYGLKTGDLVAFSQRVDRAMYKILYIQRHSNDVIFNAPMFNLK